MEKFKKFIKRRQVLKKLYVIIGLLLAILVNLVFFRLVMGVPFNLVRAGNTIKVSGVVLPRNPVGEEAKIEIKNDQTPLMDYKASDYRLVVLLQEKDKPKSQEAFPQAVAQSPIITFGGKVMFPNSKVLLRINSEPVFTSVMSDSQSEWRWTNWGQPLEDGEHMIEVSNIAPYEFSGTRDIFFQKCFFWVLYSSCVSHSGGCNANDDTCLDLSKPLSKYLKSIPYDPQIGSAEITQYTIL